VGLGLLEAKAYITVHGIAISCAGVIVVRAFGYSAMLRSLRRHPPIFAIISSAAYTTHGLNNARSRQSVIQLGVYRLSVYGR